MDKNENRLAVLIDAENVPYSKIKVILEEITKYGVPTIKRIYADWTQPNITGWKKLLLENAITPIQQYSYTSGKNSSDSAMIIDAMDILYSNKVEGFVIISSDSDFTKLVTRLREAGLKVYGIGERKTPSPFIVACDKFIYIEILDNQINNMKDKTKPIVNESKEKIKEINEEIITLIKNTVIDLADEDGWAFLADVGNLIQKKQPDFDTRNYGFYKLTHLIKKLSQDFEINEKETGVGKIKHIFLRNKN
jgi:uncharacterized LabA/DUF88 family protein